MSRHATGLLVAVIVCYTCLDAQQATPPAASHTDRPVPFHVGEVLTFDVAWSNILTAGSATLTLKERRDLGGNRSAYYLFAEARPTALLNALYHVYYRADALLDTSTLQPVESSIFSDEHGRLKTKLTRFLQSGTGIEYETHTDKVVQETRIVPKFTLDPLSSFYVLRAMPLAAGQSLTTPLTEGGKTYDMRVQVAGPEPQRTALGPLRAWRLTSTLIERGHTPATPQRFVAWISEDARRLPLRIAFDLAVGTFTLTLVSVSGA
jgi:Protein of unknown function (DUF3108)